MWRCLAALLSFFTVYPVGGRSLDFSCAWALPYVVAPAVALPAAAVLAAGAGPHLSYVVLLLITGLNHVDGLADVADALMVRDRERAKAVLEDPRKGAAGVFAIVATFFVAAENLEDPAELIWAEVFSKSTVVAAARFSKPLKPGLGASFIEGARGGWFLTLPALAASLWACPNALAALAASLLLYFLAYRHLGGANGDLLGFVMEISRVAYLVAWR